MVKKLLTSVAAAAALAVSAESAITLASGGKTDYTIVYDQSAKDPLLNPAVKDLSRFLGEITGATFKIVKDAPASHRIFIGVTPEADKTPFNARERRILSVGNDLYFYGDYRYGTAGAIYNFLREFCGCRWYTSVSDLVIPKNPDLKFDAINYKHVPSFKSIEHGARHRASESNPEIRGWVRRNNSFLMPYYAYGSPDDAWTYIGPVTHTLAAYLPPIKRQPRTFNADKTFFAGPHPIFEGVEYFKTHPEYFTLNDKGQRDPNKQACFSNPEVRKLLIDNVQKVIDAEKYDPNQYGILDFTQNDKNGGFCHCPNCEKLNKKYKTPGGVYFDFLVEMGNHFAKKYPRLTFRFFSYKEEMTGIPPTGLKFPDNMSVIIAPLQQDFSKPYTSKYNVRFLNQMKQWQKLCKEIWLWNYPTLYTFGMKFYSLCPGVYRNTENLRNAYAAGVRYIIAEQGGSVEEFCSFKDLNVYLQTVLAENINADIDKEIADFCRVCYGKAAENMIAYLKETDELCKKDPGYLVYHYDPRVLSVLHSGKNLGKWQQLFDTMTQQVKGNQKALFNVNRARMNLDAVTILCYPEFAKANPELAKTLTLQKLYNRYCRIVKSDNKRLFLSFKKSEKLMQGQISTLIDNGPRMAYEFYKREQTFPQELIDKYGKENLTAVLPGQSRRAPDVWDAKCASGFAVRVPVTKEKLAIQQIFVGKKDGLPWNTITTDRFDNPALSPKIAKELAAAKEYRCIYVGRKKVNVASFMQLATLPQRNVRFWLGGFYNAKKPNQEFDFYLEMKAGGKKYGKNTLLIDRLIVAKPKR